jgi:DNA-binding MarR family transcriptional regulator
MLFSILDSRMQKEEGCSLSRLQVFFVLYFEGPYVPVKLAKRLMVTRGNMSTLLKRLEDEDLIATTYEIGTKNRPGYKLSEKGRAQFLRIFPRHIENIGTLFGPLSHATLKELEEVQTKLYAEFKFGIPVKAPD